MPHQQNSVAQNVNETYTIICAIDKDMQNDNVADNNPTDEEIDEAINEEYQIVFDMVDSLDSQTQQELYEHDPAACFDNPDNLDNFDKWWATIS